MRVEDLIRRLSSFDPKLRVLIAKDDGVGRLATDVTLDLNRAQEDYLSNGGEEVLIMWLEE